ncbi:MAG TPA: MFS transporter, partial [Candidatus Limnocylindrales bacterium]
NGYVVAQILGPPVAAALFVIVGGPATFVVIAAGYGIAAVAMVGVVDPPSTAVSTGSLLRDAWQGLVYTWRNPTLRGLGFAISALNITGGMTTIVIPLLVIQRLGLGPGAVGVPFAAAGLAGMASSLYFGRLDTRGREWRMLLLPALGQAAAVALLLPLGAAAPAGAHGSIAVVTGFAIVVASSAISGALSGPLDIALFTVRQRRTDPAWMGRAFAVSMSFNFLGYPFGAALAGNVAAASITASIAIGVVACFLAAGFIATMVPRTDGPG